VSGRHGHDNCQLSEAAANERTGCDDMPASSIASGVSQSRSGGRSAKPHILGGSNNLRTERQRREKAEAALQKTNEKLKSIKEELAPHVLQLSDAVKVLTTRT